MKVWVLPLLPLSWMYGAIMSLRNHAYDQGWKRSHACGIPVISVGNITVGGTGKTPMAEFLLARLLEMGYRPAYLSRGYGRATKGFLMVSPTAGSAERYGDEAFQVASRFPSVPVAVCESRVEGAKQLLAVHNPDVLVLDDAFQHRRIQRNLDMVMVDVGRMPMQDHVFPAGRLREPLRGLRRAQVLVTTKFSTVEEANRAAQALRARFPEALLCSMALEARGIHPFFPVHTPPVDRATLGGRAAIAFSGLGNNAHFKATLERLGVDVRVFHPFPDHHAYTLEDIEKILHSIEGQTEIKGNFAPALILTTEKDFFRLKAMPWMKRHAHLPMYYLEVGMKPLDGWEQVEQKIKKIAREHVYGATE